MQLIIFPLLLLWAALTAVCAYPFNDNRLLNTTVLAEFIANATDHGGDGWVTVTDPAGPKTAWPKTGSDGLISIPYCYESWADENALKNRLDNAWAMWSTKLGLPGQENLHSLAGFHEAIQSGGDDNPYCYIQNGQNWDWNPKMPSGTLIIRAEWEAASHSTVGYRTESLDSRNDPHQMQLGYDAEPDHPLWLYTTAHELGHVMGLEHEHRRWDRQSCPSYLLTHHHTNSNQETTTSTTTAPALQGYEQVRVEIETNPDWDITIDGVCADFLEGRTHDLYWLAPADFTKHMGWDGDWRYQQITSFPYDVNSIMHYPSQNLGWAHDQNCDVTTCPLVKCKNGWPGWNIKPDENNAELIPQPTEVTDTDAAGIRHLYPWV